MNKKRGIFNYESVKPVEIYNLAGQRVKSLEKGKGSFTLETNGLYFARSGNNVAKIIVLK